MGVTAKRVLIVIVSFVAVYIAYFIFRSADFYAHIYKNGDKKLIPAEKTQFNILLLGYGGPGHDGPYLTDSLMVAHVDLKANKVALISLPRDLWVKLPTKSGDDFHSKINSIYQIGLFPTTFPDVAVKKEGTPDLVKQAVQTVTGLTIDNYVAIDFAGFEKIVDVLGGVDVEVKKTFDDYEYPVEDKEVDTCGKEGKELEDALKTATESPELVPTAFPCRYEHLHFDAGKTHMDGKTALKYVRSRHSLQDGSDFGRGARQQQFVKAVKDKVLSVGLLTNIFSLMDEMKNHITTDFSSNEIKKFMGEVKDAAQYRTIEIRISDKDYLKSSYSSYGGYILIPRTGEDNWKEVHAIMKNGILEITPTPIPSPTIRVSPTKKNIKGN